MASKPSASCSTQRKSGDCKSASRAGVDRIEAGFPRVSEDDARAISLILDAGLDAEIWGFSRAVRADVEALVELGVQASVVESPISDGKLAALGVSRETMLERIRRRSRSQPRRASAWRSSASTRRVPISSSCARVYETAVEAGAQEVVVVDTSGSRRPRPQLSSSTMSSSGSTTRCPCTGTGTTTSGSRPRRPSPRSRRARPGCRAP